jgi:hypothetical protein
VIVVSVIAIFVALFGCVVGVPTEDQTCAIWCYFVVILTLFAAGVFLVAFDHGNEDQDLHRILMDSAHRYDGGSNEAVSQAWDWLQHTRHCCGVDGHQDWSENSYLQSVKKAVPDSCCDWKEDSKTCETSPESAELPACFDRIKEDLLAHRHMALVVLSIILGVLGLNVIVTLSVAIIVSSQEYPRAPKARRRIRSRQLQQEATGTQTESIDY